MSEPSPFFRTIWRVNAVLLLVAGLGVLGLLASEFFSNLTRSSTNRASIDIAGVDATANEAENWFLGNLEPIQGSDFFYLPLQSEEALAKQNRMHNESFFGGGYWGKSRNFLFINPSENISRWLYSTNSQVVFSMNSYGNDPEDFGIAVANVYRVVDADTNGDGQLTVDDQSLIAISSPDGTGYLEIVRGIDAILGYQQTDANTLLSIIRREDVAYIVTISLAEKRVLSESLLPKVSGT